MNELLVRLGVIGGKPLKEEKDVTPKEPKNKK